MNGGIICSKIQRNKIEDKLWKEKEKGKGCDITKIVEGSIK
jgi:hypothetical protein